jgi:hypothetical protein
MKYLNNRLSKIIFTFYLIVSTSVSYGQVNFKDSNLAILEKIGFNSTHDNIVEFMKQNNYEYDTNYTVEKEGTETYIFNASNGKVIHIHYTSSKKLYRVAIIVPSLTVVFAKMNMEDNKFIKILDKNKETQWRKDSYPYQFNLLQSDEPASVILMFTKEHKSFVKVAESASTKSNNPTRFVSAQDFANQMNKNIKTVEIGSATGYFFKTIGKIDSNSPSIMFFAKDNQLYIRTYQPKTANGASELKELEAKNFNPTQNMPESFCIKFVYEQIIDGKKLRSLYCILPKIDDTFQNDVMYWRSNNLKLVMSY